MAKKKTGKSRTRQEATQPKRIKTKTGIGFVFGPEHSELAESLLPVIQDIEKFELPFEETVSFYIFSNKGIKVKLDLEQQAIMRDTCGFPIKSSELRAFLRQNCNFTDFEQVTINEILSALRIYAKNKTPITIKESEIQSKANSGLGRLRSIPRTVARGLETLEAYSMRKVNEDNIRRTAEQAKLERFRVSCEQGKKYFSDKKIRDYWLKQLDKAALLPIEYWFDSPSKWLKNKTVIFAITAICIQQYSLFEIIPESFKKTEQYKANNFIHTDFTLFDDLSLSEFLSYIEADLQEQGLLSTGKAITEKTVEQKPDSEPSGGADSGKIETVSEKTSGADSKEKNRVAWNEKDSDFYTNKEAISDANKAGQDYEIEDLKKLDYIKLKNILRSPSCSIKFMSKESPPRGKVHKSEWQAYLKEKVKDASKFEEKFEQETIKRLS